MPLQAADLITEVERAGLTGRGGASFPAGRKMRAVAEAGRKAGPLRGPDGTVVVANGAESEPASGKDRLLLARAPHLVLDGIALAAEAVGATRGYLSLDERDRRAGPPACRGDRRARAGRAEPGAGPDPDHPGRVRGEPGDGRDQPAERGAPKPAFVPPRPSEKGAHGRPTLVQNVETLAHVALIARFGAGWFRELAAPDPAPRVPGRDRRPGPR